jgi:FtsP/CotA-like multicopper oxidase with cupredoxin domain
MPTGKPFGTACGIVCSMLILSFGVQRAGATTLPQSTLQVVDTNPDPTIFEADLDADEQDVKIDGTTVHALIYKDAHHSYASVEPSGIPVPQIVVNVGDEVVVHFSNKISASCPAIACDTSIHWHGIEDDNDSDGTGVTQNHLVEGDTYTYRFFTHRPGIFWFHPHMRPGPQTLAGTYGALIVKDPKEATLQSGGKIPSAANTHTVVVSDTEFDASGNVGFVGLDIDLDGDGTTDTDPSAATPWALLRQACGSGRGDACRAANQDSETVLVNGNKVNASTHTILAKSGSGLRLRLINTAILRYFRFSMTGSGDNNIYRIGGEGGFLEQVRLEGGMLGSWDTKYDPGEIVLGPSARADVVVVPTGDDGNIITIKGLAYERGGPMNPPDIGGPAGDLLYIKIDNSIADDSFNIAAGNDVLGPGSIENLKPLSSIDPYLDPASVPATGNPGDGNGTDDPVIVFNNAGSNGKAAINGVVGEFEDSGPDYTQVPFQGATRYAHTGDLLEFTIKNETVNQHHPFHHHGFSFQPVRVIDTENNTTLFEFDYNEFIDVIDVFPKQGVVVKMRLEDRPRITDNRPEAGAPAPNQFFLSGGAAGRWVFHCHIFLHAALGMISELVVLDSDRDGDGYDTSEDCDDFDRDTNPGAPEIPGNSVDENCDAKLACDPCNSWASHGEYVQCVDDAVEVLVDNGSLTELKGAALNSSAAKSKIGKKGFVPAQCLQ